MKHKLYLKIVIVLFLIFSLGYTAAYLNSKRYEINSPMMDFEYKKSIIKSSKNPFYTIEKLRPLMGEEELTKFIKDNNNNEQIYTPTKDNLLNGTFRANLHNHTTNSDGELTVEEFLDKAQLYAQYSIKDGYMIVGISDHNTVLGAKEIIKVLQKHPNKYQNLKIVAGMEIFTEYKSKYSVEDIDIHVLALCINPYDKYLNKAFYKKNKKDKYNKKPQNDNFEELIPKLTKHSIAGIAHPARYLKSIEEKDKALYIEEIFSKYKKLTNKIPFAEGYYQSYSPKDITEFGDLDFDTFLKTINSIADKQGIYKTGSIDVHGSTIFRNR